MKLLFVHQTLGQFGGAETSIHLVAEELGRRGCELDLLYQSGTGRNEADWHEVFHDCVRLPEKERGRFVRRLLQTRQHDLVYLHNLGDLEVVEALLDSGIPTVRMVHDHSLYCMRSYKYNYFTRTICTRPASGFCLVPCLASLGRNAEGHLPLKWVSYRRKRNEIELSQRLQHLVVYSEYQKQELVRNGFRPEQVEVCVPIRMADGCMANEPPTEGGSPKRNLILYVGQIIRGKGVDRLLRALARVQTDFECSIIGDGNHKPHCERLCQRLGLQGRVRFQGYLPSAQLEQYYRQASVFVMSSLWPEPFGMAGPEAMRYGVPVVAFDAGGIREWLIDGENGYLVPWNDIRAFAGRVEELLRNPERACLLGQSARRSVRRYDSSRQVGALQGLFERIIQDAKRDRALESTPRDALLAYE